MRVPHETDLAAIVIDLRRRLERLERADPLRGASVSDTGITFYDAAGTRRVQVGKLPDGRYGVRIYDSGGTLILTNDGA